MALACGRPSAGGVGEGLKKLENGSASRAAATPDNWQMAQIAPIKANTNRRIYSLVRFER